MAGERERTAVEEIARDCVAVRVRTLSRAVSALYDEALRPHGLRVGQLNLLVAVGRLGTAPPRVLCGILQMEKSTLSRDVEVLRRHGWLEVDASGRGRARPLRLTRTGASLVETMLPVWREAQARAAALLGAEAAAAVGRAVDGLWRDAIAEP